MCREKSEPHLLPAERGSLPSSRCRNPPTGGKSTRRLSTPLREIPLFPSPSRSHRLSCAPPGSTREQVEGVGDRQSFGGGFKTGDASLECFDLRALTDTQHERPLD